MEQKFKKADRLFTKAFAAFLGVCFLVTPVKGDRINRAPINDLYDSILNDELLENDKLKLNK